MPQQLLPLHFVFQGGGAKLGALIGVAEEVFEQAPKLGYRIASVSGTSAGAIAACILATGKNPSLFRNKIKELAPQHLPKIITNYSFARQIWRAYWGNPIYNTNAYSAFLGELFHAACAPNAFVHISDLDREIGLFIHAVDLRVRRPVIYRKSQEAFNQMTIADALLDSSSIPFVFNTYKAHRSVVDGGLIDNFPSDTVSTVLAAADGKGHVVGISFEPSPINWTFHSVSEYVKALISTVIDWPVQSSIKKINPADIHFVRTSTTTFDFDRALNVDLGDEQNNRYRAEAGEFLRNLIIRKRLENATLNSGVVIDRIKGLHDSCSKKQRLKIKKTVIRITCNCLKLPSRDEVKRSQTYDEFEVVNTVEVIDGFAYTLGCSLVMDVGFLAVGDVNAVVTAPDGRSVGNTIIPVEPKAVGQEIEMATLMIFFHEPLQSPGEYRIEIRSRLREALFDLVTDEKHDYIYYQNVNHVAVEALEIVAYIPNAINKPTLVDLSKTENHVAKALWREGQEMTTQELGRHGSAPAGFKSVGWKAADLLQGYVAGFQAFRS